MSGGRLLASMLARGVVLASVGGRLAVDAPAGVLTAGDRSALAAHKADLLARLDLIGAAEAAGWPWVRTRVWEFRGQASWRATAIDAAPDELAELRAALRRPAEVPS